MVLFLILVNADPASADDSSCRIQIQNVVFLGFPAELSGVTLGWQDEMGDHIRDQVELQTGCESTSAPAERSVSSVVTYIGPGRSKVILSVVQNEQVVTTVQVTSLPDLANLLESADRNLHGMIK
jgi:hypothetical protein